jgi:transcriptional regulator with XRE-family HTH domain
MPQPIKNPLPPLDLGNEPIHDRLQRLRRQRGVTQAKLAQQVGITTAAISAYELGRVRMVDEMIVRISLALGISSDELLGLSNRALEEPTSLKIMRRIKNIEKLPPAKQRAILQTLDMALQNVESDQTDKA